MFDTLIYTTKARAHTLSWLDLEDILGLLLEDALCTRAQYVIQERVQTSI